MVNAEYLGVSSLEDYLTSTLRYSLFDQNTCFGPLRLQGQLPRLLVHSTSLAPVLCRVPFQI